MKLKHKKKAPAKLTAEQAQAALDRIHAAAKKSGADKLSDDEIDEMIATARSKKKRPTRS